MNLTKKRKKMHTLIHSQIQLPCLKMTSSSMTRLLTTLLWIVYGYSMTKISLNFFSVLLRYNIHMKSKPILSFWCNLSIHVITTQGRHRTFPASQKVPFCPLPINIHSPEVTSILISVSISWHACELHINEIVQYKVFCVSRFLLTKISRDLFMLLHVSVIFLLMLCSYPLYECTSTDLSFILTLDGHLGCCQFGGYYEECYYEHFCTYLQVDTCTHSSWVYIWKFKRWVIGFNFKRKCRMVFQRWCAILYSYQQCIRILMLHIWHDQSFKF